MSERSGLEDANRFMVEAMRAFPGAYEIRSCYCEECGMTIGRWSDAVGAVVCDDCWRLQFFAPRLPKGRVLRP